MKSYDYAHRCGVTQFTWEEFASLTAHLAELVEISQPQVILGIARAGLFPATLVACSLRCELFPIRLTRRVNDVVVNEQPIWKVSIPQDVIGKVVVIIDEIADSGTTLAMAAAQVKAMGAKQVITASLVSHSWADPPPQICPLITDAFVIFPWDQQVLTNGKWEPHPEIIAGLKAQGGTPAG